jgi:hypothetical protein
MFSLSLLKSYRNNSCFYHSCSGSSGWAHSLVLHWLPSTTRWSSGPSPSRAGLKLPQCLALPRRANPKNERLLLISVWRLLLPVDSASFSWRLLHCSVSWTRSCVLLVPSSVCFLYDHLLLSFAQASFSFCGLLSLQLARDNIMLWMWIQWRRVAKFVVPLVRFQQIFQ